MDVTYELTIEDVLTFNVEHYKRSPMMKKKITNTRIRMGIM